jgi:hypothetical protein
MRTMTQQQNEKCATNYELILRREGYTTQAPLVGRQSMF